MFCDRHFFFQLWSKFEKTWTSVYHIGIIGIPLKQLDAWNSFKKGKDWKELKEFSSCPPQKCSWEIVFIMFGDEFSPKAFCVCWQTFPTASAADFVHTVQLFIIIQFIKVENILKVPWIWSHPITLSENSTYGAGCLL